MTNTQMTNNTKVWLSTSTSGMVSTMCIIDKLFKVSLNRDDLASKKFGYVAILKITDQWLMCDVSVIFSDICTHQ